MTWARLKASGSGSLSWRVEIEGWPYCLVSHADMVQTESDGRQWVLGLISTDFTFSEELDPVTATVKAGAIRVGFADPKVGAQVFAQKPDATTWLDTDFNSGAATATVKSTSAFATSGKIYLDTETMSYTAVSTAGTVFQGLTRGVWSSLAQDHYTADGSRLRYPEVTDRPVVLEGRRVRFYAYGPGQSRTGNGTLVWKGIASTDASFNGIEWSFIVDALYSVFDQDVGADLEDPSPIRGIYYPATAPLVVFFSEGTGATYPGTTANRGAIALAGFWETQADFMSALQTALDAELLAQAFNQADVWVIPDGDSWALEWLTDSGTARWMRFQAISAVDFFEPNDAFETLSPDERLGGSFTVTGGRAVRLRQAERRLGTVPRATFGYFERSLSFSRFYADSQKTGVDVDTYPPWRVYLGGGGEVTTDTTSVVIEWESNGHTLGGAAAITPESPVTVAVDSVSAADRSITTVRPPHPASAGEAVWYAATGGNSPQIRQGRGVATGNLRTFLDALTTATATYVNTGAVPRIVTGDFDTSGSDIDAASDANPITRLRNYTLFAPASLREIVQQECLLLGVYPALTSAGSVTFKRLRLPGPGEVGTALTAANILSDDQILGWERQAFGIFNTVRLRTGYNPIEDEHQGDTYVVRDVASFGRSPKSRSITIEPKSVGTVVPLDYRDVIHLAGRLLGTFGGEYQIASLDVPMTLFDVYLGDVVDLTWSRIPDSDGTLGVTSKIGIVLGREWTPREARGRLTVLLTDQRVGGYVPASKINTVTDGTDGTIGPFTVDLSSTYFPTGTSADDLWAASDLIRIYRYGDDGTTLESTTASANDLTANDAGHPFHHGPSGAETARGARVFFGDDDPAAPGTTATLHYADGTGTAATWTALKADCTITAWIYLESTGVNQVFATFYGGTGETEADNILAQLGVDSSNKLWLFYEYNAGTNVSLASTGTSLSAGQWYRVDWTRDTSGNVAVYLDGSSDDSWTGQQLATGGTTANNVRLGANSNAQQRFEGKIYALTVRDVEKTGAAIAAESVLLEPDGDTTDQWCLWDSVPASVDSVASNSLTFTADRAWTRGSDTWCVGSQIASSVSSTQQRKFTYLASSTLVVDFSGADAAAFTFAP